MRRALAIFVFSWVFDQVVLVEESNLFVERIGPMAQEVFIAGVFPMPPEMLRQPGRRPRPLRPFPFGLEAFERRVTGEGNVNTPAVVEILRGLAGSWQHGFHIFEEGLYGLTQVRYLGRPVVHLKVAVVVEIRGPRRAEFLVPDSLEIRGQTTFPGTADQQVAAVLEKQRHKSRVGLACLELLQPLVKGKVNPRISLKRETYPAEQLLMLLAVRFGQGGSLSQYRIKSIFRFDLFNIDKTSS